MKASDFQRASTPICLGWMALGLTWICARYLHTEFTWEAEQLLIRETGILAFVLFVGSFLCTPARRLLKALGYGSLQLASWRRSLGLASTFAALCHLGVLMGLHIGDAPVFGAWFQPYAQAGAAALLLLLILSLSSFPRPTRLFKLKHWKTLHRVVFVVFLLLLVHVLFGPHLPSQPTIIGGLILLIISALGRLNP